ncbi:choice-of-anchor J domain-containing protein [uncultured Prevotella sp.]|uniref:choice-of-anchor J domain-containing protein n=1 Tax=uncultured Prevotella sp. TaxID=159272 RepID=UPI0027E24840|nr:choice-of-anchor J domain-containing protein [uncultured Prevotella sp.]
MKKILYTMLVALATTLSFTSCEDVPAPYDIPNGGNTGGGDTETGLKEIYSENFDNETTAFTFKDVTLTGGLTRVWKVASYNNNGYLNASAFFSNASHASESWAVSPAILLGDSKKATLSFKHAINKLADVSTMKDMMTAWVSTNYAGDVKTAEWQQLVIPKYPEGVSWTFVESGDIDLTAYCGKTIYIAFKYTSTDDNSGGWEIDNFTIKGDGTAMSIPSTPDTPDTPSTPELAAGLNLDTTNGLVTFVNDGVAEGETATYVVEELGLEDAKEVAELSLSDGTKLTFGADQNTAKTKYYASKKSIRIYKNNTMHIAGKSKIAKIVFTCDSKTTVGNTTATLSFDGNNIDYKNVFDAASGKANVQFQFTKIAITYAK